MKSDSRFKRPEDLNNNLNGGHYKTGNVSKQNDNGVFLPAVERPEAAGSRLDIGIIMDGNGRWAKKRLLPRTAGHSAGAAAFRRILDCCVGLNSRNEIRSVTFYAFSTENASRPAEEVSALIRIFGEYLDDIAKMSDKNVRLSFAGNLSFFPEELGEKMRAAEEKTAGNDGLICVLAVNYGGRDEILRAVKEFAKRIACSGNYENPENSGNFGNSENSGNSGNTEKYGNLTEEQFSAYLYTAPVSDVDLIIRTGGEKRISNFLLWQGAYAELIFTDTLWPDFGAEHLHAALEEFRGRHRRMGKNV